MFVDCRERMGVKALSGNACNGAGVRVAVLDSGFPDGHTGSILPGGRANYVGGNANDALGHATAVSSLLFGYDGFIGVCPYATPYYVKVIGDNGIGSLDAVVKGIRDAIIWECDIINLSLGFFRTDKCPESLERACREAADAGVTIFCAAGNDGDRVYWPGALPTTICVGSVDRGGVRLPFSSCGEVDFVAPGRDIDAIGLDGGKTKVSGTSFSTPLVAGVAALIAAQKRIDGFRCSPQDLKCALRKEARDVMLSGWDCETGYGAIGLEPAPNDDPVAEVKEHKTVRQFFGMIVSKLKGFFRPKE